MEELYGIYFLLFLLGMEKEEEEEKHLQDILTAQVQKCPPPLLSFCE
jgi:hypothetical protein